MRYLMLIKHSESIREQSIPDALLNAMGPFITEAMERGVMLDTAGLKPTAQGTRIRSANGKLTITDGPFTEAKEIIGGYAMINVASDAEAREFGRQFMELHRVHFSNFEVELEVRPLEGEDPPSA